MEDWREGLMMATILATDKIPISGMDAIFVTAQNDLQLEILTAVVRVHMLYPLPRRPLIFMNGLEKYENVPHSWGFKDWKRILLGKSMGVSESCLHSIGQASHLGKEAELALRHCAQLKVKRLLIAVPPYKLLRAFLNFLGVTQKRRLDIQLYCLTVGNIMWGKKVEKRSVVPGAPAVIGTCFEQFEKELEKIETYYCRYIDGEKGITPIASFEEGWNYLKTRD